MELKQVTEFPGGQIVHEMVALYECYHCGFRFDAAHENTDESGYECSACGRSSWEPVGVVAVNDLEE